MKDLLIEIRDIVVYKDTPHVMPPRAHELFTDFCNIAKIEKDCVENCQYIHRQSEDHEQIVWRTYTNKWAMDGVTNFQIIELKALYQQWRKQQEAFDPNVEIRIKNGYYE